MAQGNFAHGDYFIDCGVASEFALRAIFGVWINVCVAVVAFNIRSIFRSRLRRQLLANGVGKKRANLWHVSPATTPSEVLELRLILTRSFIRGDFPYVFASLVCVLAAIIGAASTIISNHAIVSNTVTRRAIVPGRLVTSEHAAISGAAMNVTARVKALDKANAPLEELFDFTPDDSSGWVFVPHEWNNTWRGECTYSKYPAVELVVYPTNSSSYQDEIPLLGNYLPQWATVDPTRQGATYAGFFSDALTNGTGDWRDLVVTYVFGSVPDLISNHSNIPTVNISFANYLAHGVARDPNTTYFQTAFKSDVHVAECTFNNYAMYGGIEDQANPFNGQYANAASNVASVYQRYVTDTSIAQQPVVQPTAQQMVRNWQAYLSVKDAQYPHPVQRKLTVSRPIVQIRLSALVTTIGTLLFTLAAASVARWTEPLDQQGKRLVLPSSQLDWIVQAARERFRDGELEATSSPSAYAAQRQDLVFVVSGTPDGKMVTCITSATDSDSDLVVGDMAYTNQQSKFVDEQVTPTKMTIGSV